MGAVARGRALSCETLSAGGHSLAAEPAVPAVPVAVLVVGHPVCVCLSLDQLCHCIGLQGFLCVGENSSGRSAEALGSVF